MSQKQPGAAVGIGLGVLFCTLGVMIYLMVRDAPELARAPLFVIDAAAGCFFFAGISVVARSLGAPLVARLCALPVAYLLAVPGLWIVFGGDSAQCSVTHIAFGTRNTTEASDGLCQAVFGGGAAIVLVFALLMTIAAFRGKGVDGQARQPGPAPLDQR